MEEHPNSDEFSPRVLDVDKRSRVGFEEAFSVPGDDRRGTRPNAIVFMVPSILGYEVIVTREKY